MKIFLDTANLEEIKKMASFGIIDGLTTNPTLIAQEGMPAEKLIKEITKIIDGPISSEVIATDHQGMIQEGRAMAKWHHNVYVKVPMTPEGIKAVKTLSDEGIKVNVTLVFSATQALLAAKAGAKFVSPFVGRLDDISGNGINLIAEILDIFQNYNLPTEVLAASIRHPQHVLDSALAGAHIATMPAAIFEKLFHHPLTDIGLEKFLADWKKSQ